jgi:hypothetical protein
MEEKKFIKLEGSKDTKKFWITTKEGKETGEYIEINLEGLGILDRIDQFYHDYPKNRKWIRDELLIIKKKQDFTKKGQLMSNNQRLEYEAVKKYYNMQKNTFNLFLGENGVDKLLYGRELEWDTIEEIQKIIVEQIIPELDVTMDKISNKIIKKYNISKEDIEEIEVIK